MAKKSAFSSRKDGKNIIALTAKDILEEQIAYKLAEKSQDTLHAGLNIKRKKYIENMPCGKKKLIRCPGFH
ncbi:MAG: hypothetical protein A2173_06980 [Planctomycetes bacterium RBG_13_44_8b]|nr:MAG: hypothetical protein A2173_06980 [Planctomycetes bacterium RBG_13_44_8b]